VVTRANDLLALTFPSSPAPQTSYLFDLNLSAPPSSRLPLIFVGVILAHSSPLRIDLASYSQGIAKPFAHDYPAANREATTPNLQYAGMSFFRTKRNTNNMGPASTSPDEYPIPPPKTQDSPYGRNGTVGGPSSKKLMGKPMSPGRRRRLWQSYGLDWLLTIVVWVSLLDRSDLVYHIA
jgi:hypothetical protein